MAVLVIHAQRSALYTGRAYGKAYWSVRIGTASVIGGWGPPISIRHTWTGFKPPEDSTRREMLERAFESIA